VQVAPVAALPAEPAPAAPPPAAVADPTATIPAPNVVGMAIRDARKVASSQGIVLIEDGSRDAPDAQPASSEPDRPLDAGTRAAVIAGAVGDRSAPMVPRPERTEEPLGTRVVVPVSNPRTVGPLVRVAAQVAAPDSGAVVAINVLPLGSRSEDLRSHRRLADTAERVALAAGAEVETTVRIDSSPGGGVLHTLAERSGTCLVMGWKGYANAREGLFGTVIDQVITSSPVPVLVCRPGEDLPTGRIVIVLTGDDLRPAGLRGTRLAFEVASRMARQAQAERVIVTDLGTREARAAVVGFRVRNDVAIIGVSDVAHGLAGVVEPGDVVVTGVPPTTGGLRRDATRLARAVPTHTVVVVVPR
jgi:nucleotide-binding universal stress UspA family protein